MTRFLSLLAGCALLGCSGASSAVASMVTSTLSTVEQYCFPKSNAPFSADSIWPTITMIYSGFTLTTTPVTLTITGGVPTVAPGMASSNIGGDLVSASSTVSAVSISSQTTVAGDDVLLPAASDSTIAKEFESTMASGAEGGILSTLDSIHVSVATSGITVSPGLSTGGEQPFTQSLATPKTDSGALETARASPGSGSVVFPSNAATTSLKDGMQPGATSQGMLPIPTTSESNSLADTSASGASGFQSPSPTLGEMGPSSPAGPPALTGGAANETLDRLNGTLEVSPAAVNALSLAQFLKNLGVFMFNTSNLGTAVATKNDLVSTSFATLIGNIYLQEQTQREALQQLLHRAGSADIPSCQYVLPGNRTEVGLALSAFKAVEGGVLMSLAESLPPDDTAVAVVLSSMSSVAARHNALLRPYVTTNGSVASFDTPITDVWAYNLALAYVQPGSCAVEQLIPLLPTLSLNERVSAIARPSSKVTFAWDVAGRAAASRSGKPLFIGWVNQVNTPVYTPLTPLGDGRGTAEVPAGLSGTAFAILTAQPGLTTINDLTDATLAGPVVVNLLQ